MPYAPGIQYRGDEYVAQGQTAVLKTLGDFLTGMVQRSHQATQDRAALNTLATFSDDQDQGASDQLAQRGKQASALRNVLKSYSDDPNLGHVVNGLGVDQLEGIMHGMAVSSAMIEAQADIAQQQAQARWLNQRAAESSDEGGALAEFAKSLAGQLQPTGAPGPEALTLPNTDLSASFGGAPTGGGAPAPAASSPDINGAVLNAMASMGKTNPRMAGVMLGKILPTIMANGTEGASPSTFVDSTTGAHFARLGKQLIPAGYDPAMSGAGKPVPQTDTDGNLIGYSITDLRGHSTFHPARGGAKLKQAMDQSGNPIDGFYMDDSGKLHDTRDAMQKQGFEVKPDGSFGAITAKPAATPAAAGGMPTVKTQKDFDALKSGTVYTGKDGKQYRKP